MNYQSSLLLTLNRTAQTSRASLAYTLHIDKTVHFSATQASRRPAKTRHEGTGIKHRRSLIPMTYTNAKPQNRLLHTPVPAPRTDARSDHQLPHAMHAESFCRCRIRSQRYPNLQSLDRRERKRSCAWSQIRKLCQVAIRRPLGILHALQILAFDQAFDLLLDHVDIGQEPCGQLLDDFGNELLVGKLLPLPKNRLVSISLEIDQSSRGGCHTS